MILKSLTFAIFLLGRLAFAANDTVTKGRIVSVPDGDTLCIQVGKAYKKVRLHGIDAPENDQADGG